MPTFEVESPAGLKYDVEVPEGAQMTDAFKEEIFRRIQDHEDAFDQSAIGTFGSSLVHGAGSAVAEPIRGAGELLGSNYLKEAGGNIKTAIESNLPISPERQDSFAAKAGGAIGQGAAQLGLALGTGGLGLGAKAVQASVLAPAFLAGAAGGADESRRLGLQEGSGADKLNQLLYGGAEVLSESLFGLGSSKFSKALVSDAPNILRTGARSTAGKRFVSGVSQEAAEEPIAGALQDFSSRVSAEFGGVVDPTGEKTVGGADLRSPFDPAARGEEALYGAIGALPFGGHAALQRDADVKDVASYRARVAKAKADGDIAPKNQAEVDALDAKAADFLEKEGVPMMANAAQSVINGDAQGIVELKAIANNPTASPAARAAAQAKIDKAQASYKAIADKINQHQKGEISFDELKAQIPEYETLNPYSKTNQEKQLEAAQQQAAAAPVQAVAAANAAVGNTATAQALLDTQAARDKAGALRRQAQAARKAPAKPAAQTQAPAQTTAPAQTAAPAEAPNPVATAAQVAAEAPKDRETQIAETIMPHVEEQVNTYIPARVRNISQALDEGDFDTAAAQFKALEGIAKLAVLDRPDVARAMTARLSPEQQNKIRAAREAAADLVNTVRKHIAAKAAEHNTPVSQAAAQSIAPKPQQAELSLGEAPATAEVPAPTQTQPTENNAVQVTSTAEVPVRESPEGGEGVRQQNTQGEEAAGTQPQEIVTPTPNPELDAVNAALEANRAKRKAAKERASAAARKAQGKLGFFGADPTEQAVAEARLFKAHVELGYLLLKKGYIKFKIWAREFIRESDDLASIKVLRRVYRMLRDTPDAAAELIRVPQDEIQAVAASMDAAGATERMILATTPSIESPGYFGEAENLIDWVGNTTFFEGRTGYAGAGKAHRIFVDTLDVGDLVNPSYRLVYLFGGEVVPTGDVVTRQNETEWAFNGQANANVRADRFRMYTTTLLDGSFTELPDGSAAAKSKMSAATRAQWNAFNKIVSFDDTGRLSFPSQEEVARWAASVRYIDGDQHYPAVAEPVSGGIKILLGGTSTEVGSFREDSGRLVFGQESELTKGEEETQNKFQVLGFEVQDSTGKVQRADTPQRVLAAWPVPAPKTHNIMAGFGAAPVSPEGKRVTPAKREAPFKSVAELEAWVIAKRLRQGHKLDINAIRKYVKDRGPRSMRSAVDKAISLAEKAYATEYAEEKTSEPVVELRDNGNIGVQRARFVQGPLGLRPLFTNNVFETAVQINMGYRPEVPAGFTGKVHPNIVFDPETLIINSASDASGKVSKQGDHLAVRQRDPRVVAKSEARMATEDEMNEALLNDFDFVDGLPKAEDEDNILRVATKKLASMRGPTTVIDRALIETVALGNLFRQLRLAELQKITDSVGYSAEGKVIDEAKLPEAVKAVGEFITTRRAENKAERLRRMSEGEVTRGLEEVSVLPDRFEELAKAAATARVLRNGPIINHGAYWRRALNRVLERYRSRVNSGFAAAVTTAYNEEGGEQPDMNDEEQLAAGLATGELEMNGSDLRFEDAVDESPESEEAYMAPEGKPSGKAVQLDLFGRETTESKPSDEDEIPDEAEDPVSDLAEEKSPGISLISEASEEPEFQSDKEVFHISSAVATQRNKNQRAMMRRILRGLPIELRNAVFNSPTTDRFDRIMETYHMMRKALIRAKLLRSEERPTFREAMDMVFKHHAKVPGFEKIFPPGTMDVFNHFSRAFASAPGTPDSAKAKAAAEHLGLVSGDPQSAIDALKKIVASSQVSPATRQLAQRVSELPAVQALQQFTMIPAGTRGLFIPGIAAINITPQGSVQELAESLLHEFGHLATEQAFIDIEGENASPEVKEAYDTITQLREELAGQARQGAEVFAQAFENNEEFMSFLFSDPAFNSWVSSRPASFLKKLVNAIRRLLGLRVTPNPEFEKAWAATLLIAGRPAMFAQSAEKVSEQAVALVLQLADMQAAYGARPLMAGVNAQNIPEALKASFAQAQEMSANKESIEKIRKETGWFRAPTDRQWRWEISDHKLKLDREAFNSLTEGEALPLEMLVAHEDLFNAYPEARRIMVVRRDSMHANGSMQVSPTEFAPVGQMNVRKFNSPLIVHELQHWLQHKEGFFPGSSPKMVRGMLASGELSEEDLYQSKYDDGTTAAYHTYRQMPGEREARFAAGDWQLTPEQRAADPIISNYPVTKLVLKLRELAAKGGISTALDAAEDSVVELSSARESPAWYDGTQDKIFFNPDIIALETQNMSAADAQEYMVRLMTHENIHRADFHSSSQEEYKAYGDAMSHADFEWVAARYYVDPAEREYALGRAPGMTAKEKAQQRQGLIAEHRRAMIELAEQGETTEQFALFAASNPGLVARIARHIANFIRKLTAQIQLRNYNGSARDLRHVMETLNNISELDNVVEDPAFDIAEAKSVAVPILSRRLGNYKVGGWGTTGFLNAEAAEAARVRDAKLRAMQTRVQQHRDDLSGAVKKEYASKGLAEPTDLINQALGSIENPVSPQQLAIAENLRTRAVRNAVTAFLGQMNLANSQTDAGKAAIIRENARKAYRDGLDAARKLRTSYINRTEAAWVASTRAKQAAAFAALAPETSKAVRMIRDDLDAMQQKLLESGVLGPKTAARVTKTFGIYLTRSYQVYNETMVTATGVKRNLWTEFLRNGKDPKAQALLDAARAAIFEDAVIEKAKELRQINNRARTPLGPFADEAAQKAAFAAARKANPPLSSADALTQARAALQSGGGIEVENLLEKYIEMGENIDTETDVLKRRENIHPAIQALWGVYEENEYNAYNTMMKINTLISTQKMFNDIYEHGKANGYIFDKEGVYINGERTVPLGGTGTQANRNRFGILAGTYGPAMLKAGLEESFGGNASSVSTLWNTLRAITGYAMATKTKYSIQGTARNFVGNVMFAVVNLNLHKLISGKARSVVGRQLNLLSKDKTAYDNYIRRLIELRVVSESAYEFRDLTKEFSQQMVGRVGSLIRGNAKLESALAGLRKVDKLAGRLHQGADDYWKVLSFEGELGRIKQWEPHLTQEQAEEKAAWKIRHTMPTYTEAFYFIKRLRQQPFISPFITFTAEIYRTMLGTIKVGLNEMAEGHRTGRVSQTTFGLARIMNMVAAVAVMPQLIAMLGKAAFGAGDDDKEDGINPASSEKSLGRFVPEYMRGNSLMRFKGKDYNEQIYMDASYLLPQDIVGKVVRMTMDAFMKPENIGVADKAVDAAMAFMKQVTEPVTKEQLFFGAVMQAKFNYNQAYDRKIYKDTDTPMEMTEAIVRHIYTSALEPGTLRTGRLIWEAADGVVRDGMKLEVPNEMLGVVGIKKRTIVLDTRFAKNADMNKLKLGEAATYITTPMQSNSTVPDEDLARGYVRANEVRMDILRESRRDYLAAINLGMPQGKAVALLRDSQLSEDDVAMVVGNVYTPYQISDQVFNKALERSKVVGQDRARVYLNALKEYPKRQPLIPE